MWLDRRGTNIVDLDDIGSYLSMSGLGVRFVIRDEPLVSRDYKGLTHG